MGSQASKYDAGKHPSIALNNKGQVLEVHQSEHKKELWYHVGLLEGNTLKFGSSYCYDKGVKPSVALDDFGNIIAVHKSDNRPALFYRCGKISAVDKRVQWNPHVSFSNYDQGVQPYIALSDSGYVVEVHKSENRDVIWYKVGKLKEGSVEWQESVKLCYGSFPSISIDTLGYVLEAHQSPEDANLICTVGKLSSETLKITWGKSQVYERGFYPSVFLHNTRKLAIGVNKSVSGETLCYQVGKVDTNELTVTWTESVQYDEGTKPMITMDGLFNILEVHKSESLDSLWCRIGTCDEQCNVNWLKTDT
eukprot:TRINITY_DN10629_c0_g1_i1.p1 TRINITY_DN10629_c0_g1~~TRINITY_DN10629_c0_g1_i1.p1  ORF type:complete len:307 (+),score=43.90 TRINITY_DN10629_c0_g1_i1:44-964(+)